MKNDHIDIFDLIDEVAKKNNASHVVKFLKQIVHEQSESNWKRIDAFEQRYNKIYNETYQSNETDSDLKEQEESNYEPVESGVYSSE